MNARNSAHPWIAFKKMKSSNLNKVQCKMRAVGPKG